MGHGASMRYWFVSSFDGFMGGSDIGTGDSRKINNSLFCCLKIRFVIKEGAT